METIREERKPRLFTFRRSQNRYKVDASGTIYLSRDAEAPSIVRDISSKGLGVVSSLPLPVGETVAVSLHAPYVDNFTRKNLRVVWCKKLEDKLWRSGLELSLKETIKFA